MQVNVAGIWTEVPDSTPVTVPFDATGTANPSALGDNKGCPPGYFCEYVPGIWWENVVGGETVKVCRRFDAAIGGGNTAVLADETGPGLLDATLINVAAASAAVVSAVTPTVTWLLVGLGALALLYGFGKGHSSHA